jgi:PAS domain S-box-containing protein
VSTRVMNFLLSLFRDHSMAQHVASDALIALFYFLVPLALILLLRERRDFDFRWMLALVVFFLAASGVTHLMAIYTLWRPVYRLQAVVKAFTALSSVPTALVLIKLVPMLGRRPTQERLQSEIRERERAEKETARLHSELETRIEARTAELEAARAQLQWVLDGATAISIIATDAHGTITVFNSGAEIMLGYQAWEMVGKKTPLSIHLLSEVTKRSEELAQQTGRPVAPFDALVYSTGGGLPEEREWTYIRKDGTHVPVALVVHPLYDAEQNPAGFLGIAIDISARKKLEAASLASEEHFRLIVEAVQDYALVMLDAGGRIISWNGGAGQIQGYVADEIVGLHFSCFYTPEDIAGGRPEDELRIAVERGRYSEEGWRVRKDGSRFLAEVVIAPVNNGDGALVGFAKVVHDITERKRTEERFHLLVEAAPSAMIMVGADGLITLVNAQTELLFGYERSELIGRPIGTLLPERFRAHHGVRSQAFFAAPEGRKMGEGRDLFGLRKDGSEVPVEISLSPMNTSAGQFVLASVTDIAYRRKTERSLREQAQLLDQASDAIFIRDDCDRITFWNQGAERLYGWHKTEALGCVAYDLLQTEFPQPLCDIEAQIEAEGLWKGELVQTCRDGAKVTVASGWTRGKNDADDRVSTLVVNHDITARKLSERQMNLQANQLRDLNKELEEFAFVASHDLKAPLRVIDNASKWLAEDLQEHLTDETREHLALLRNRVKRMDKLLDDLLEYARIGHATDGRFEEMVNGDVLIGNVRDLLALDGFTWRTSPSFASVQLRRMPLQQILLNLAGNAIKHHDKKTGEIEVTLEDAPDHYIFAVKDDGPGIPRQFHDQIFKMFHTLKPRDKVEGSGMGLALVRKNIEVFGGALRLESSESHGSVFSFTWPKKQALRTEDNL